MPPVQPARLYATLATGTVGAELAASVKTTLDAAGPSVAMLAGALLVLYVQSPEKTPVAEERSEAEGDKEVAAETDADDVEEPEAEPEPRADCDPVRVAPPEPELDKLS